MSTSATTSPLLTQTNLVSDGFVPAAQIDPALLNPWGVSYNPGSPGGPFWVSDNNAGVTTLYNGAGQQLAAAGNFDITIARPNGQTSPASPTGQVHNSGTGFNITSGGVTAPAVFIFATEDGTISGWNPTVNKASSVIAVDNSQGGTGAVYKGLAIGTTSTGTFLYAANFRNGTVDVFNQSFAPVNSFTDPSLPAGYAPFNVQVLNGNLFVTYALQDASKHDDVGGAGNGFVDEYSLTGTLLNRVASGGDLNSPWGLDIAPASFGSYAGDLLVGNFRGGTIDAYNLATNSFVGQVLGANGAPIKIGDLWSLTTGNGGAGGSADTVYFTAGLSNEQHGLFGSLSNNAPLNLSGGTSQTVDGVITTGLSSASLGAGLSLGERLNFIAGTEAVKLTDGTLSVGPDTNEATIQRLYLGLLNRGSDPGGIAFYDQVLTGGNAKAIVAADILTSAEYAARHGTQTDQQFVSALYQDLLGRGTDSSSSSWIGLLAQGTSRAAVAVGVADSAEAKAYLAPATVQLFVQNAAGTLLHELYETGLGRETDPTALQNYQDAVGTLTPSQLVAGIVSSPEFLADHAGQSNSAYVASLYQAGLGRAPDTAGSAFWTGLLNGGQASQGGVLLGIATSGEATGHLTHNLSA